MENDGSDTVFTHKSVGEELVNENVSDFFRWEKAYIDNNKPDTSVVEWALAERDDLESLSILRLSRVWGLEWQFIKLFIEKGVIVPRVGITETRIERRGETCYGKFKLLISKEERERVLAENEQLRRYVLRWEAGSDERYRRRQARNHRQLQTELDDTKIALTLLEAQLVAANQEIERLKAGGNGAEAAPGGCDDCPAKMKNRERLEVFKIGVKATLRSMADGVEQSKEGHLALWRELHGLKTGKPNSRYFDAFRQALDDAPHLKHPDPKQK